MNINMAISIKASCNCIIGREENLMILKPGESGPMNKLFLIADQE